jgi:hypothetical protein
MDRLALRILGGLALCAGLADVIYFQLVESEKHAHYVLGHWFDAVWGVQVPLLVAGVVAIALSFLPPRGGR